MLIVISPAKRMRIEGKPIIEKYSVPQYLDYAEKLVNKIRKCNLSQLQEMMKINIKLAHENLERFIKWNTELNLQNSKQAIFAYTGDVFLGIDAKKFNIGELDYAQQHLRIFSGLYGILNPLDLVQPYRLEIGLKYKYFKTDSLYSYWEETVSNHISDDLKHFKKPVLINLASNEYFKTLNTTKLKNTEIITPDFREYKNGSYKFINVFGKRARGLMVKFIINNKIVKPEKIKLFNYEGYEYNHQLTRDNNWVFTRG